MSTQGTETVNVAEIYGWEIVSIRRERQELSRAFPTLDFAELPKVTESLSRIAENFRQILSACPAIEKDIGDCFRSGDVSRIWSTMGGLAPVRMLPITRITHPSNQFKVMVCVSIKYNNGIFMSGINLYTPSQHEWEMVTLGQLEKLDSSALKVLETLWEPSTLTVLIARALFA